MYDKTLESIVAHSEKVPLVVFMAEQDQEFIDRIKASVSCEVQTCSSID